MQTKNLVVIISTALVVLLAGLMIYKSGMIKKNVETKSYFGAVIDSFCIDKTCLTKDDGWWVEDGTKKVPAETELVDGYIKKLENIKLVELVSQNPERFESLGIGTTQTRVIEIGDKRLELGNLTSGADGTFVRGSNTNLVYKIPISLEGESLSKRGFWEMRSITNLPRAQIKKVLITGGKKNKTWEIRDEKKVSLACYLPVAGYLDKFETKGSNIFRLEIETEGGKNILTIGAMGGKKIIYWATVDEKRYFEIKRDNFYLLTGVLK